MNIQLIIAIIVAIIAILALVYFSSYSKLKSYKNKLDKAEELIDKALNDKIDIIIALNVSIKKVTGKKDYLKEYISTKDLIIQNIEKDLKLEEAVKLIQDLIVDFNGLMKDAEFVKNYQKLKENEEILTSAKNMFNQNAHASNNLIKQIPNNVVAKIAKFKIRSFYNTSNKIDDNDAF